MKGKHLHGAHGSCGYGRNALGSLMMRGAPNEKHEAPSNLLARLKVKPQMQRD